MEVKKSRLIVLIALMIVVLSLMTYFVVGEGGGPIFIRHANISTGADGTVAYFSLRNGTAVGPVNVSGTRNLSLVLGVNGTVNVNVTNVSFAWYYTLNGSVMRNVTQSNINGTSLANATLTNMSHFNLSFDTTALPDGIYNVTYLVQNRSVSAGGGATYNSVHVNESGTFVLVDNHAPNITLDGSNRTNITNTSYAVYFSNLTAFSSTHGGRPGFVMFANLTPGVGSNGSNNDRSSNGSAGIPGYVGNGTLIDQVIFEFDNASFNRTFWAGFNVTATRGVSNYSGYWNGSFPNLSLLRAGNHTIRIYMNDTAGNKNTSVVISFFYNNAPNVTWLEIADHNSTTQKSRIFKPLGGVSGLNFSVNASNVTFNVSANWTLPPNGGARGVRVIFMFDNASGNDFNLTGLNQAANATGNVPWSITYNVSALEEGHHTVKVYVNDSMSHVNATEYINFTVDKTAPSLTVTCDTGKTVGQQVSCTCTAADTLTGVTDGPIFAGTSTATETTTGASIGSFTSSTCLATDRVGNQATKTSTYSVVAAVSGGAGGGGSGGGTSVGKVGTYEKKVWTSIVAGETASVVPKEAPEMPVSKVEFTVADTVHGAWVKVEKVERSSLPPQAAEKLTGKVSSLISISKNELSMKDDVITDATVGFKVEKKWLTDNSVDKSDVALLRYIDESEKWTELAATLGEDDGTYQHYTAKTPGFSYFAVAEKGAAEEAEVVTAAPPAEKEDLTGAATAEAAAGEVAAPAEEEGGVGTVLLWVVVVLVVLAGIVWLVKRRR